MKPVIYGLTLWQPMAWAIAAGHKRIENRPWSPWRGVTHVAIHAGRKYHREHADQIQNLLDIKVPSRTTLVYGAILCVVRLDGYIHEDDNIREAAHEDPWFSGPFGWKLTDLRVLQRPIYRRGSQGLWMLNRTDEELLRDQGAFPDA